MDSHEFIKKAVDIFVLYNLEIDAHYDDIKKLFFELNNKDKQLVLNCNVYIDEIEIDFFEKIMLKISKEVSNVL
jgi:hypothetical protein